MPDERALRIPIYIGELRIDDGRLRRRGVSVEDSADPEPTLDEGKIDIDLFVGVASGFDGFCGAFDCPNRDGHFSFFDDQLGDGGLTNGLVVLGSE